MMHRSTPVGILVLALAGLIAVGCSAPTTAVLQALLVPAGAPESSPAVAAVDPAAVGSGAPTWWPHPEGYAMELPAGWSSMAVASDQTDELVATVALGLPGLASRIGGVIDGTPVRVSAIAAGPVFEGGAAVVLVVLAQPTEGRRAREVKAYVREQIAVLPGLTSQPVSAHDVVLDTAQGVRFDYTIDDPDLGEMSIRSYLFRFGRQAYLVNFVAGADVAEEAEVIFDQIADSLRFGV
jgi:hypothetical protein